jgi:urease accessory protein
VRAHARLTVELDDRGRTVIRRLRSAAPITLVPARTRTDAVVRLVNSAQTPLGGDDLELTVQVGPGARLRIDGVAATLALPGQHNEPSRFTLTIEVAERGAFDYRPEPTVITARANHEACVRATLDQQAHLHIREVLVLGRAGERAGRLNTTIHVTRAGRPLLRQRLEIGDPTFEISPAGLANHRVIASDLRTCDDEPSISGEWWSRTKLAAEGSLVTALGHDTVTVQHCLELARSGTPARCNLQSQLPDIHLS